MELIVVAHNIRSTFNIGSILRTCDGFGVKKVFCTGYTPYPEIANDTRLPHIRQKLSKQISKTALGAEKSVCIEYFEDPLVVIKKLKNDGYTVVALEQAPNSELIYNYKPKAKTALILGEEVNGINKDLLAACDEIIEIPMQGTKESFNVSVAAGIAIYNLNHPCNHS